MHIITTLCCILRCKVQNELFISSLILERENGMFFILTIFIIFPECWALLPFDTLTLYLYTNLYVTNIQMYTWIAQDYIKRTERFEYSNSTPLIKIVYQEKHYFWNSTLQFCFISDRDTEFHQHKVYAKAWVDYENKTIYYELLLATECSEISITSR